MEKTPHPASGEGLNRMRVVGSLCPAEAGWGCRVRVASEMQNVLMTRLSVCPLCGSRTHASPQKQLRTSTMPDPHARIARMTPMMPLIEHSIGFVRDGRSVLVNIYYNKYMLKCQISLSNI